MEHRAFGSPDPSRSLAPAATQRAADDGEEGSRYSAPRLFVIGSAVELMKANPTGTSLDALQGYWYTG
jgi:hypothetical protein